MQSREMAKHFSDACVLDTQVNPLLKGYLMQWFFLGSTWLLSGICREFLWPPAWLWAGPDPWTACSASTFWEPPCLCLCLSQLHLQVWLEHHQHWCDWLTLPWLLKHVVEARADVFRSQQSIYRCFYLGSIIFGCWWHLGTEELLMVLCLLKDGMGLPKHAALWCSL